MLDALLFVRCGAAICLAFGCKQPLFRISELSLRPGATALLAWHDLPFHKAGEAANFPVHKYFTALWSWYRTCLYWPGNLPLYAPGREIRSGTPLQRRKYTPTPCKLSTAVEPAAWSSRRQQTVASL